MLIELMEHIAFLIYLFLPCPSTVTGECSKTQYQCFDGSCIDISKFCDSSQDCPDNSDENQCYLECIKEDDPLGYTYRGMRNITYTGFPCQHWSSQYPNEHKYVSWEVNFCRNLDLDATDIFPWCYANTTSIRWEKCSIPFCESTKPFKCSFDKNICGWRIIGDERNTWERIRKYGVLDHTSGNGQFMAANVTYGHSVSIVSPFVNLTKRAKCMSFWRHHLGGGEAVLHVCLRTNNGRRHLKTIKVEISSDWTKTEIFIDEKGIFQVELEAGYPGKSDSAHIAIDDISIINEVCPGMTCSNKEYQCNDGNCIDVNYFCDNFPDCEDDSDETNCESDCILPKDALGVMYFGNRNLTASGRECIDWNLTYGTFHHFDEVKKIGNMCRNPKGSKERPWCYTQMSTDSWEYCGIHRCAKECLAKDDTYGVTYRGFINVTKCGIPCQQWAVKIPHYHSITLKNAENYCRNPGDELYLWCYTMDPNIRVGYCTPLHYCVPNICLDDEWLCDNGQCIPLKNVNDGNFDCIDSSDETSIHCSRSRSFGNNTECPGDFQCRTKASQKEMCVSNSSLCNGQVECLYQDDESGCYPSSCPPSCSCSNLSALCKFSLSSLLLLPKTLRHLDLSKSNVDFSDLLRCYFPFLIHLNLSYTGLESLVSSETLAIGLGCENLQMLDLRYNQISVLHSRIFQRMFRLRILLLEGNPISLIENYAFYSLGFVRNLNISGAFVKELSKFTFTDLENLYSLDFSGNRIRNIEPFTFYGKRKLHSLNLSYNFLSNIGEEFLSTPDLEVIDLSFNRIRIIRDISFQGTTKLQEIRLQGNRLTYISISLLTQMIFLKYVNLSRNEINEIETGSFNGLNKMRILDLRSNAISPYHSLFRGLTNLKELYVDSYTICCVKPENLPAEKCYSPQDIISSCLFMIKQGFLSIGIWFLALMAIIGNSIVIVYRLKFEKWTSIHTFTIFVMNLTFSDLLMGIYLFIIAYKDNEFRGYYFLHDKDWRDSTLCSISGIFATVSSETSAIFILFITIDRVLGIRYTFSSFRFSKKSAVAWSIIIWCFTITVAVIPILDIEYFNGKFYSVSGVCISLPLSANFEYGHWYSFSVFIGFNFILFFGICLGQFLIFRTIRSVRAMIDGRSSTKSNEAAAARSLFMVVLTDILCWLPIAIMGLMVVAGVEIPVEIYAWIIVLVLPLNSAINPYLYTISSVQMRHNKSYVNRYNGSHDSERLRMPSVPIRWPKNNFLLTLFNYNTITYSTLRSMMTSHSLDNLKTP